MMEEKPSKLIPAVIMSSVMVGIGALLVLLRLLVWGWQTDVLGLVVSREPCKDEVVEARPHLKCSSQEHTGTLVVARQTTWLACKCSRSAASTSETKAASGIAASTN